MGLLGLRIGLRPISDNSMLLHIRTGVDMVRSGHVPRTDPYSFTAHGHTWVVESWFAELTYGIANRIAGLRAVVVEQAVLMAVLAIVIALLARTGRTRTTLVAAGVSVFAGVALWSPRPLLFGLLGMALLITVVERRWSPWWVLPIVWVWVNTHGSFPFGLLWLGASYVGLWFDTRARPQWLDRYVIAFVGGLVVSLINPLGPKLLAFPFVVEARHKVFADIIEWRSPNFQMGSQLFSLVFFALGLLLLIRYQGRWVDALIVVGFLAGGLISERNLAVAAIVMAPALARALAPSSPVDEPSRPGVQHVGALVLAGVVLAALALQSAPVDLHIYPTDGEAYLKSAGLLTGHRIAAIDIVGDYREFVEGAHASVFIDDRYDMYPTNVVAASDSLAGGGAAALVALRTWDIDVVLWARGQGPTSIMQAAGGWRLAWTDKKWEILVKDPSVPPTTPLGA